MQTLLDDNQTVNQILVASNVTHVAVSKCLYVMAGIKRIKNGCHMNWKVRYEICFQYEFYSLLGTKRKFVSNSDYRWKLIFSDNSKYKNSWNPVNYQYQGTIKFFFLITIEFGI